MNESLLLLKDLLKLEAQNLKAQIYEYNIEKIVYLKIRKYS